MSIYIRELTKQLVKLGHAVDIYTRVQDTVTPEIIAFAPEARQIHISAGEAADIDKLLIYPHVPDFACKVEKFRRQHSLHYNLVFSHYWLSGSAGIYLQTWWQIPHVMMFHTLGAIKNSIGIGEDEPDLRIDKEKQISHYCQRIIASTENEKAALNHYYAVPPEKISVIPCGVNMDLFQLMDKTSARQKLGLTERKIILFVGRVERLKGIDKLIQAIPFLGDLQPQLIIVGEDGNRPGEITHLEQLADHLGVADSITFTGLVDYEKLPDYYNAADVCVFPSYYESFGLVPLESMSCGTPVIATDVGDLRNIIRQSETGFVLPDSRPLLLAENIRTVLLGNGTRMADAQSIRDSIKDYGWQHIAAAVSLEFSSLLRAKANNINR